MELLRITEKAERFDTVIYANRNEMNPLVICERCESLLRLEHHSDLVTVSGYPMWKCPVCNHHSMLKYSLMPEIKRPAGRRIEQLVLDEVMGAIVDSIGRFAKKTLPMAFFLAWIGSIIYLLVKGFL